MFSNFFFFFTQFKNTIKLFFCVVIVWIYAFSVAGDELEYALIALLTTYFKTRFFTSLSVWKYFLAVAYFSWVNTGNNLREPGHKNAGVVDNVPSKSVQKFCYHPCSAWPSIFVKQNDPLWQHASYFALDHPSQPFESFNITGGIYGQKFNSADGTRGGRNYRGGRGVTEKH